MNDRLKPPTTFETHLHIQSEDGVVKKVEQEMIQTGDITVEICGHRMKCRRLSVRLPIKPDAKLKRGE